MYILGKNLEEMVLMIGCPEINYVYLLEVLHLQSGWLIAIFSRLLIWFLWETFVQGN